MANRRIVRRSTKKVNPVSKSELIRRLEAKGKTTGEIKTILEKQGFTVHYSEIYGALEREPVV